MGQNGYHLLSQIYAEESLKYLLEIPAINILRQVWLQHYYIEDDKVNWCE